LQQTYPAIKNYSYLTINNKYSVYINLYGLLKLRYLILFLLVSAIELNAQTVPDSTATTPFRKGRNMVGLSGSIRSSKLSNSSFLSSDEFVNQYSFDVNLGKFIADKNLLGLVFSTTRDHSIRYVEKEQELILLGPQYRLFFGNKTDMGLYFRAILLGAYYVENSFGSQGNLLINETIEGFGLGGDIGFGYAYIIADKISFEIGFDYLLASFKGEFHDNFLGTKEDVSFIRHDYRFSFGFNLLFDRLRNE
jgi:hypothetical protein